MTDQADDERRAELPEAPIDRLVGPFTRFLHVEAASGVVLLLFTAVGALFLRLAIRTEARIASGGLPGAGPVRTFQLSEVEECYREYLRVPGFEDKKAALAGFLERERR